MKDSHLIAENNADCIEQVINKSENSKYKKKYFSEIFVNFFEIFVEIKNYQSGEVSRKEIALADLKDIWG